MSSLETAEAITNKAGEAFDKIDDKEKKEGFLTLIESADENSAIKWCKEQWNQLSEDQKMKLYNRGALTVRNSLKNQPVVKIPRMYVEGATNTVKHGFKNAARFKFLEEIPVRFLVEFGIFDKPEGLTDEKLCKDIKSDAGNYHLYVTICEGVCSVIPEAEPAVPFINALRKYTKWYKDHGTETIITRLNEKKEKSIRDNTSVELAGVIGGNNKKAA